MRRSSWGRQYRTSRKEEFGSYLVQDRAELPAASAQTLVVSHASHACRESVALEALTSLSSGSISCFSAFRRSAAPTLPLKARGRVLTAAVSMMRAAATQKTSTRTIAARLPASPALRIMRVTRTPQHSSRCRRPSPRPCRLPVGLPQLPPQPLQGHPSSPPPDPHPLPLQPFHRAPLQPHSPLTRLSLHLQPTPTSSRHPLCTPLGCPHLILHCSP